MRRKLAWTVQRLGFWPLALCTVLEVTWSTGVRLALAGQAHHPGHADASFYYAVVLNLAHGRGLQVDYVWHYLSGLPKIPHYSNDYWMPLTSVVMSLAMRLAGSSVTVALFSSIVCSIVLVGLTYWLGRIYSGSSFTALVAAGVVRWSPLLFDASLTTDSAVYYAVFATAALLFMMKGWPTHDGSLRPQPAVAWHS